MVEAGRKRHQHDQVHAAKLHDVHDHAPQRDLQRAQVGVDGEDVDELEGAEDVGGGEEGLGDEVRVVGVPLLALHVGRRLVAVPLLLHLRGGRIMHIRITVEGGKEGKREYIRMTVKGRKERIH